LPTIAYGYAVNVGHNGSALYIAQHDLSATQDRIALHFHERKKKAAAGFLPRPVTVGLSSRKRVSLLDGQGAFLLSRLAESYIILSSSS
jgi:hypothetical protein